MAGGVEVHLVQSGIDALMAPGGPVAKFAGTVARPVLAAAIDGCPEDTGQLKQSLGMAVVSLPGPKIQAWVGVRAASNERKESATTNAEVALIQEFGAPAANVPATHFLSNALNAARR